MKKRYGKIKWSVVLLLLSAVFESVLANDHNHSHLPFYWKRIDVFIRKQDDRIYGVHESLFNEKIMTWDLSSELPKNSAQVDLNFTFENPCSAEQSMPNNLF